MKSVIAINMVLSWSCTVLQAPKIAVFAKMRPASDWVRTVD